MMDNLFQRLPSNFFFVTPDVNQALGVIELGDNVKVITGYHQPLVDLLRNRSVEVFCLEEAAKKDEANLDNTGSILAHEKSLQFIRENSHGEQPAIVYFKPSPKVDWLCGKYNFLQLGGRAPLNRLFEDKFLLNELFADVTRVPENLIGLGKYLKNEPTVEKWLSENGLVIQTGRGWAGSGTKLCTEEQDWQQLVEKNNERKIKVSRLIVGKTYTVNLVVEEKKVFVSPVALQINAPNVEFASNVATTCGRTWPSGLDEKLDKEIVGMGVAVARVMQQRGYRGFAGIDAVVEAKEGTPYLVEVNPRLTASESFYTRVELENQLVPLSLLHYLCFVKNRADLLDNFEYESGAIRALQLSIRSTSKQSQEIKKALPMGGYVMEKGEFKLVKPVYTAISQELNIWPVARGEVKENEELFKVETCGEYDLNKLMRAMISLKHELV